MSKTQPQTHIPVHFRNRNRIFHQQHLQPRPSHKRQLLDNYNSIDSEGNGIGNKTYTLNEDRLDRYLLMEPQGNPVLEIAETIRASVMDGSVQLVATLVDVADKRKFFHST